MKKQCKDLRRKAKETGGLKRCSVCLDNVDSKRCTGTVPDVEEKMQPNTVSSSVGDPNRIRMFLGHQYPDPFVRGDDPDPDPSLFSEMWIRN
jgi:hypothetical protein